ncbi:peptidyl-prolyl cis-trans isomerase-related [Holotrichia oblita]|nr:peptidyl-prolyl cis-trans isomerase-related [Holotrichia oblita]
MIKKIISFISLAIVVLAMQGCTPKTQAEVVKLDFDNSMLQFSEPAEGEEIAVMKTNMGTVRIRFFPEQAPKAVENFITHAKDGYYNGIIFHRVIKDFVIQGGDPLGTGTGGQSIWGAPFEDEFSPELRNLKGALSMANSGENTNGSQFFIVLQSYLHPNYVDNPVKYSIENQDMVLGTDLEGKELKISDFYPKNLMEKYLEIGGAFHLDFIHTVFGMVYEGYEVLDAIEAVETSGADKPVKDVIIESVTIELYTKQ